MVHDDTEFINRTFKDAACFGNTGTVEFLLNNGRITSDSFDKALEYASSSGYGNPDTAFFLYIKKLASGKAVLKAFEQAADVSVAEFLFENEVIAENSINVAFDRATCCYSTGQAAIMKFLLKNECISAESIGKAFISAAISSETDALEFFVS
ncbi:hypothetical protein F441_08951 [Phytophthora nicotianae CJ01A1]|uniref:Uncharacterized protein n=3 Tax=Phytophthora nicotianae TaxID=4792 RepID=W2GU83_PHYNI|nr:hypothetical protein L915_08807 [Phytophthora nicotianae]ETL39980.1 hypothetical protein L916_08736 [Phytophthora nicotianae]ETL93110.1 hypothetical protein L917_08656 [Phytophthora nicotianae]ETO75332.1 hypothetical protein F444_09050 [Phytophthora nicotianae P1976]ETP16437.1 hypothetical protein F441_08951 [Phytophthora nicotianae CJ01A1]